MGSSRGNGLWQKCKYRDMVRQFIKGTDGFSGAFAECLCGSPNLYQEGEFASIFVKKLRKRQMRNFFLCLMVSQINYFRWDKKDESSSDFLRFCSLMTKFRHQCESLGLDGFLTADRLQWHGHAPRIPDWSETSRFVAFTLVKVEKKDARAVQVNDL
ncbi:hypothetical protein BC332_18574 [Capsicum chinense]|nr:hypothetical protein BC332_18574 [Capsicum chinense]